MPSKTAPPDADARCNSKISSFAITACVGFVIGIAVAAPFVKAVPPVLVVIVPIVFASPSFKVIVR